MEVCSLFGRSSHYIRVEENLIDAYGMVRWLRTMEIATVVARILSNQRLHYLMAFYVR
jgi:hypothetical protein